MTKSDRINMSEYDFDSPPDYDSDFYRKIKRALETSAGLKLRKRKCLNPKCGWEDLIKDEIRFCPECGWEVEGWRTRWGGGEVKK